jgi:4-amino-4-deoxy-L-arabinose transferase-like glycosyltransferase
MNKILALFILALAINVTYILFIAPPVFVFDEGSYALMTLEFARNPASVVPTVTGEPVEYKPPLFTWVMLPFYYVLQNLQLATESVFRLPSALFGAASAVLVFLIAKTIYNEKTGLAAAIIFITAPPMLFSSSIAMMESFSIFLILASIYSYLREKIAFGAFFLGLLILTKWLYVLSPIVFVSLFFFRKPKFRQVLLSFIAVPLFLASYLAISWAFGSFDNLAYILLADIMRSEPASLLNLLANIVMLLNYTFPISIFFLVFAISERSDFWKEKHVILMGLLIFLTLLSNKFLPWYSSISFPAMVIFVASQVAKSGKLAHFLLSVLIILNLMSMFFFPLTYQNLETKNLAQFSKGKNVTFYMTETLYFAWESVNNRYRGTNKSYLLLEQHNVGFLFYRFNDSMDYGSVSAVYADFNESPGCDDYLVVDSNATVPGCYNLLWNTSNYWVYSTKE